MSEEERLYARLPAYIEKTIGNDGATSSQGTIQDFIQAVINKSSDETERVLENKLTDKPFPLRNIGERKRGYETEPQGKKSDCALALGLGASLPSAHRASKRRKATPAALGLLSKEMFRYAECQEMYSLWDQYMHNLLSPSLSYREVLLAKLAKADYHGSIVRVVQATAPSMVGLSGLVLYESTNMFRILTPSEALKSIPKRGTVLSVEWRELKFYIYGNHFRMSPAERSAKKFKAKGSICLQ